jgi:hypothetical protein
MSSSLRGDEATLGSSARGSVQPNNYSPGA